MNNEKIFLARQKIYNKKHDIFGYELLYRNSEKNKFPINTSPTYATLNLISNIFLIGAGTVMNKKYVFINFTQDLILNHTPNIMSEKYVVVELLENMKVTSELLKAICILRKRDYIIALDDVEFEEHISGFGNNIDIYKIDFKNTTYKRRLRLLKMIRSINPKSKILAEKVSTEEEYKEAKFFNYDLFQGYYFDIPMMLSKNI